MYSGRQNPETDLTDEEHNTLKELVAGLNNGYPGQAHSCLGFSGYSAQVDDKYVIASPFGFVNVFDSKGESTAYLDTTGVMAYLCKIMTPAMVKHIEEGYKAMEAYTKDFPNL